MNNVSKLAQELETLVDENGKVKESYQGRANFILNQLNQALGTEYSMNDGIINQYQELKKSVEELTKAKKVEALIEAEQGKYNEAIKNKAETYSKIINLSEEVIAKEKAVQKAEEEYREHSNPWIYGAAIEAYYATKIDNAKKDLKNTEDSLNAQKELYDNYLENIRQYENDMIITETGTTEEINNLIAIRTTSYSKHTDDVAGEIQQQIANQLYDLEITKKYLETSINAQDEAAQKECQIQKESQEEQLRLLAENLAAMTSTTEEMTPAQVEAWKQLATDSHDTYMNVLNELNPDVAQKIQDVVNEVNKDRTTEQAFKDLGDKGLKGFNSTEFYSAGQSAAISLAQGMQSKSGLIGVLARNYLSGTGHADGLAYVPSNNYVARLHEGERVLTKKQNQDYTRNHINNNSNSVIVNIYPQTMTEQEMIKVSNYIEREWGKRS